MTDSSSRLFEQNPDAIANRLISNADYRDGLQEIAIGAMILTYTILFGMTEVFKGWFGFRIFMWGNLLLMIPLGYASQWLIKKVRTRFLIAKVGYVKLKPVNRKKLGIRLGIILGLGCVIAALAALAMLKVVIATHRGVVHWSLFPPSGWAFVGVGIYGAAFMIFRARLFRYVIGGVIMAALGILLAFIRVPINIGLTILFGFAGLLALISGAVVFFLFLRQPAEPGE
jgi:hypothetical protein